MADGSSGNKGQGGSVDYPALLHRLRGMLMRLLLANGSTWAMLAGDASTRSELDEVLDELDRALPGDDSGRSRVLLKCARKMYEINGGWRSDPGAIRMNSFGDDEYVVKFPDFASESTYYFRVVGDDVSVMFID